MLRANRGRRDQTERRRVLLSIVVKPVNDAARNAERLSRPDVDLLPVHGPGQHSFNAVDRLFVMVMAVGRSRQALRAWNYDLKCRDVAARILSGNQKATNFLFCLTVDKNSHRHSSQMARTNKRPTTSITAQVTP